MRGPLLDQTLRRQIILLLLCELWWGAGTFFVVPTTTLPAYLQSLGGSRVLIGVMAIGVCALPLLLQFFARSILNRFTRRKRGLIQLHFLAIIPYFLVPIIDLLARDAHPALVRSAVVIALCVSGAALGIAIPLWLDMVAQVVPLAIRGRYFGLSSGLFSLGGIAGAGALIALQHWLGTGVFRGAFFTSGVCFTLSMLMLAFAPIPEGVFAHPSEPSLLSRLRAALRACHPRANFGRLVVSLIAHTLAIAILPFLVLYATDAHGLHLPASIFGQLTFWQACGGAVGSMTLGWIVDHRGPRWPWVFVTLLVPAIVLLYPHGQFPLVIILCSLGVGAASTHWSVSMTSVLEYSPSGDKSGFVAIANLASFVPAVVGPLLFAMAINGRGYHAAFLLALGAGLLAFIPALTILDRDVAPAQIDRQHLDAYNDSR